MPAASELAAEQASLAESALLAVEGLSKTFQMSRRGRVASTELAAVTGMSFSVSPGGSVALVGESGCGKTTIARMIVGLERPTEGTVSWRARVLEHPVTAKDRRGRAKLMQMVFQNPYSSLSPSHTVRSSLIEVVGFHTAISRDAREAKVEELARNVGLSSAEVDRRPRSLSGGQCQRAAIARALAAEPELLVLDEAVSALDVSTQAQILNLIDELRARLGIAILLITHDLAVVRQVCNEVIVMNAGRLVESGKVPEVLSHPRDPYTRRLLAAVPHGPRVG